MSIGKNIRMNHIFRKDTGNSVCVAIDHGGIAGPMEGINNPYQLIDDCVKGGADCILTTRGFARTAGDAWDKSLSLVMRLTGGFTVLGGRFEEELITSPETALTYGASGAAVTVKFGHAREGEFIKNGSLMADACNEWGLPLMVEAMAKGKDLASTDPKGVKLASRAAMEIGADLVKTYYTGSPDSFREVVEGCPVPIVILGGEKTDSINDVFSDVYYSMQAGARGIAIGRNIWQHKNTVAVVEAMAGLVHEGWTIDQALKHVGK
jgi:DhnA family fructose-bisphosphate aldolase class Ia